MNIFYVNNMGLLSEIFARELFSTGNEVTIYNFDNPFNPYIHWSRKLIHRVGATRKCLKKLRAVKYDLLHIHFATYGFLGLLQPKPFIVHCHGSDLRKNFRRALIWRGIEKSLTKAKMVFYSTPDLYQYLQDIRPDAQLFYNPIDTETFSPKENINHKKLSILSISQFSPMKGVDVIVPLLKRIAEKYPEVDLMANSHDYQESNFGLSASGVRFFPRLPNYYMPTVIQSADIVIGQFKVGSLGRAELEAMACGKPVIANFDHQGVYPEAPPIISCKTTEQALQAISELTASPKKRIELGNAARNWVMRYHSHSKLSRELFGTYQKLI